MEAFTKKYTTSYHYLEACELAGNLLVADRKYARAEPFYAELAKALGKITRCGPASGQAGPCLPREKRRKPSRHLKTCSAMRLLTTQAESQRTVAKLGKARCLAATNKTDEAIKMAQDIIDKADAGKTICWPMPTTPWAHRCTRQAAPRKPCSPSCTSTSSTTTRPTCTPRPWPTWSDLFLELHQPDHAGACLNKLKQRYPNSPWAAGK